MKTPNILQIDVEEWYSDLNFREWKKYEDRIVPAINKILLLLEETNNKATFFILGYIAEKFPDLVIKIKESGNEVASHGYNHKRVDMQTPREFKSDLSKSLRILKKITGCKILGYRAPQFTIMKSTLWATDILKGEGLLYDSSVFPVENFLYGMPDAPRYPYRFDNGLIEIPLSVFKFPFSNKTIGATGGFYLRFFPYFFIKYVINKINKSNNPAICYLHPWELDSHIPKIEGLKWYNYYNLKTTEKKFRRLLNEFRFISTEQYIKEAMSNAR